MKRAIIIYSKTGNTLSVAKRLIDKYPFDLFEVKANSDDPNQVNPLLISIPDVIGYDELVFASPVHGFNLSRIMLAYLNQLPDLSGKRIDLFITHFFPYAWMGGTRSLKQMKQIIESKNGQVRTMTSINWKSRKRENAIENMIGIYDNEAKK